MSAIGLGLNTSKRRLFISDGASAIHLFTFHQRRDGSIYIFAPKFGELKWLELGVALHAEQLDLPGDGKISVHGSGITHVRSGELSDAIYRRRGHPLQNDQERQLGLRHLITAFPTDRNGEASSSCLERRSDITLAKSKLNPHVFVFWAIPILFSLEIDGFVECEEHNLDQQWGVFTLRQHALLWLSYRYREMVSWPNECHVCVDDGYNVPLILPGDGVGRIELRVPQYQLDRPHLKVRV